MGLPLTDRRVDVLNRPTFDSIPAIKPWVRLDARPAAIIALGTDARIAGANKFRQKFTLSRSAEELMGDEYVQQVNLRTRLANSLMSRLFDGAPNVYSRANENPHLSHHNAPHAKRVEHTLQAFLLKTVNPAEQILLEDNPELLGAVMVFPRLHDFLHQVVTGQRNIDEKRDAHEHIDSKRGHDMAAGLVMAAQYKEYAKGLRVAYQGVASVPEEQIIAEAKATMLLAQILSSSHGKPNKYEKTMGARSKKAYEKQYDVETGTVVKVPLAYQTEADAKALLALYQSGEADPFSFNQAQMIAMTTYQLTHTKDGAIDTKVVSPGAMADHVYGTFPVGLHPTITQEYGDIFTELAQETKPFEDLLSPKIMAQRPLIEHMGQLAIAADTFDFMSDPQGRVVRSLLTQMTLNDSKNRPIWQKGMTKLDVMKMFDDIKTSNGNDREGDPSQDPGRSLTRRLAWELLHWFPMDISEPELNKLIGDVTVLGTIEQFNIIRSWMHADPQIWKNSLEPMYTDREEKYEKKRKRREAEVAFDASWLHGEKNRVTNILGSLPHATEFSHDDLTVLNYFEELLLGEIKKKYGMTDDRNRDLQNMSVAGGQFSSPYAREMYDVVFTREGKKPPIRVFE